MFAVDAESSYTTVNLETSNGDVQQTTSASTHVEPFNQDKEVQVQTDIKTFKTVGTQTEHLPVQGNTNIHPDDINKLLHLEDHSYSLGPNNDSLTEKNREIVEPCPTPCTPVSEEQLTLVECGDVKNGASSDVDNDDSSSLYSPSASDDSETDDEYLDDTAPAMEKKFIVFESQLHKLFKICQHCGSPIDTTSQKNEGSMVTVTANFLNGHSVSWQSQPLINGTAAGNVLIPAAILFSGNTYKHTEGFARHLNLQFISSSHYYTTQTTILFPVVQHTWIETQTAILKQLKKEKSVDVCGDGRCDSPGHSAKYGTYTLMDEKTNLIIEFSVVQVTEVTSSNAMEYEGCKRTLNSIIKKKIPIRCLTTDRHTTITSKMRTNYSNIVHQYDVWHLSKWVTKKLTKKAKKKDCQELLPWIQSVSNHLWWCAATCEQNADLLREKWLSLLHHIW